MELQMKSIQYILKRSQCLSIMDGPDGEIIKRAIFVITKTKEFKQIIVKWEEISKNLTDTELEYICKHIHDIYIVKPTIGSKSSFEKGKEFTTNLIKKLADRNVVIDFNIMVALYSLAKNLEEANPNDI